MRLTLVILLFYKRLIIPSLLFSIIFGSLSYLNPYQFSLKHAIGLAYIFMSPFMHYLIYDVINKNEYYFYYNLGLSRLTLWIASLTISLLIGIILMIL